MMVHVRGKTDSSDDTPPKLEPSTSTAARQGATMAARSHHGAQPSKPAVEPGLKIKTRLSTGTVIRMKNSPGATQKAKTTPKKRPSSSDDEGPNSPPPKRHKLSRGGQVTECDPFCWICHRSESTLFCAVCPRGFHPKCLPTVPAETDDWVCNECEEITTAECLETRNKTMAQVSVEQLSQLLKLALGKMKSEGTEPFQCPVDASVEHYHEYVIHPMDLSTIERNIRKKVYGCTQAFLADVKWIYHNCVVFNGMKSKLSANAKTILKTCRMHMNEIEICADCYSSSCTRGSDNWFCDPCKNPHTLVWAKLKGYPFWPAKVLRCSKGQVEVRFFGQHDRAWLTKNQVYLLSKELPIGMKGKKNDLEGAMTEVDLHVRKLRERFGHYEYAPPRTPFDPPESTPETPPAPTPGRVVKRKKFNPACNLRQGNRPLVKSPAKVGSTPERVGLKMKITPVKSPSKRPTRSCTELKQGKSPRLRGSPNSPSPKPEPRSPKTPERSPKRLEMMTQLGLNPVVHVKNIDGALPKLIIRSPDRQSKYTIKTESPEVKTSDSEADLVIDESAEELQDEDDEVMEEQDLDEDQIDGEMVSLEPELEDATSHVEVSTEPDDVIEERQFEMPPELTPETVEAEEVCDVEENFEGENLHDLSDDQMEVSVDSERDASKDCEPDIKEEFEQVHDSEPCDSSQSSESELEAEPITDLQEYQERMRRTMGGESPRKSSLHRESLIQGAVQSLAKMVSNMSPAGDAPPALETKPPAPEIAAALEPTPEPVPAPAPQIAEPSDVAAPQPSPPSKEAPMEKPTHETTSPAVVSDIITPITVKPGTLAPIAATPAALVPETAVSATVVLDSPDLITVAPRSVAPAAVAPTSVAPATVAPISDAPASVAPTSAAPATVALSSAALATVAPRSTAPTTVAAAPITLAPGISTEQATPILVPTLRAADAPASQAPLPMIIHRPLTQPTLAPVSLPPALISSLPTTAPILQTTLSAPKPSLEPPLQLAPSALPHTNLPPPVPRTLPHMPSLVAKATAHVTPVSMTTPESCDVTKYTLRIAESLKSVAQDMYNDILRSNPPNPRPPNPRPEPAFSEKQYQLELERLKWLHTQQVMEMRQNFELTVMELRKTMMHENMMNIQNIRRQMDMEKQKAIKETKKKQWCAHCGQEAIFYCCWNTSYCDYGCQARDWPRHMDNCTQQSEQQQDMESDVPAGHEGALVNQPSLQLPLVGRSPRPGMGFPGAGIPGLVNGHAQRPVVLMSQQRQPAPARLNRPAF